MHWLSLPVSSFRCVRRLVTSRCYRLLMWLRYFVDIIYAYLIRHSHNVIASSLQADHSGFLCPCAECCTAAHFLIVHHVLVENWWCITYGQLCRRDLSEFTFYCDRHNFWAIPRMCQQLGQKFKTGSAEWKQYQIERTNILVFKCVISI